MRTGRGRRKRTFIGAGDALFAALADMGLSDQARRLLIFQCWDKAVGSQIAARTQPESFSRGVLLVRAKTSTWQNELTFLKAQIISQLNAYLGQALVKDLKVISGAWRERPAPPPPPRARPERPQDIEAARACGMAIDDAEVRSEFEHLMRLHLAHR